MFASLHESVFFEGKDPQPSSGGQHMVEAKSTSGERINEGNPQQVRASALPSAFSVLSFTTSKLQNHSRSVLGYLLQQLSVTVFLSKILHYITKDLTKIGESILKGP